MIVRLARKSRPALWVISAAIVFLASRARANNACGIRLEMLGVHHALVRTAHWILIATIHIQAFVSLTDNISHFRFGQAQRSANKGATRRIGKTTIISFATSFGTRDSSQVGQCIFERATYKGSRSGTSRIGQATITDLTGLGGTGKGAHVGLRMLTGWAFEGAATFRVNQATIVVGTLGSGAQDGSHLVARVVQLGRTDVGAARNDGVTAFFVRTIGPHAL